MAIACAFFDNNWKNFIKERVNNQDSVTMHFREKREAD
tara:strand:+ start:578 stop:691 length:114 start_codon:yes stop_codon:yes gene_type:complete